ncbi:MAG: AcrR family transcriptional regulator [Salibacteraceae bacterium]|jgi:AcrR family transcriptional regulator
MPKTETLNQAEPENIKKNILVSAMKLFAQNGYEPTSIAAIVKETNISSTLFEAHFEAKEDLIPAILHTFSEKRGPVQHHTHSDLTANKKLKLIIDDGFTSIAEQATLMRWLIPLAFDKTKHPLINEIFVQQTKETSIEITNLFRELDIENPLLEIRLFSTIIAGIKFEMALNSAYDLGEMHQLILSKYNLHNL